MVDSWEVLICTGASASPCEQASAPYLTTLPAFSFVEMFSSRGQQEKLAPSSVVLTQITRTCSPIMPQTTARAKIVQTRSPSMLLQLGNCEHLSLPQSVCCNERESRPGLLHETPTSYTVRRREYAVEVYIITACTRKQDRLFWKDEIFKY